MKTVLLILFILTSVIVGKAQDTLYMKDGKMLEVRVYEIENMKVYYKLYRNLKGPLIKTSATKVKQIVYENGQKQSFEDKDFKKKMVFSRRNRINLGLLTLGSPLAPSGLSYERLNASGTVGIEIPIMAYFSEYQMEGLTIGLNIKKYIGGDGKGFYFGPSFNYGTFDMYGVSMGYLAGKIGRQLFAGRVVGFDLGTSLGVYTDFVNFGLGASVTASINFSF